MITPGALRLLSSGPASGAENMAVDEALLEGRARGTTPFTLRFFTWAPPTLSLGRGQPLDARIGRRALEALGIGLVRRPTGGSAILHEGPELELTYSLVGRAGDFPEAGDVLETYRVVGEGLVTGLVRLGVPATVVPRVGGRAPGVPPTLCFARTGSYEIAARGRKLSGSAQRRQGGAFLQHGSILLGADPDRLRQVFPGEPDPMAALVTLAELVGRPVDPAVARAALVDGLAARLACPLVPGTLSAEERASATRLLVEKYGTARWTEEGRNPAEGPRPLAGDRPARRGVPVP